MEEKGKGLEELIRMAEEGDPRMQYEMYSRYRDGFGVPDEEKSEYYQNLSREAREREQEESGMTEEEWLEEEENEE